jgi:hypothetical protein
MLFVSHRFQQLTSWKEGNSRALHLYENARKMTRPKPEARREYFFQ